MSSAAQMYSALLIAIGTSQHGGRTCLCPVRHLGSNLALVSTIFIFCLYSVGDTLQPKRRGPKPLVDEVRWLNGSSESASKEGHPQGRTSSARHPGCTMTACEQMTGRPRR